jgi:hypothetical protein
LFAFLSGGRPVSRRARLLAAPPAARGGAQPDATAIPEDAVVIYSGQGAALVAGRLERPEQRAGATVGLRHGSGAGTPS